MPIIQIRNLKPRKRTLAGCSGLTTHIHERYVSKLTRIQVRTAIPMKGRQPNFKVGLDELSDCITYVLGFASNLELPSNSEELPYIPDCLHVRIRFHSTI